MVDSRIGIRRIEVLRRALRAKAVAAGEVVSLRSNDLLTLLDEVGRLAETNGRLRRQYKRMRVRSRRGLFGEDAELWPA
ncbi:MAG: hypothetical protein KDE27_13110 [Planctomycetes bacterium]|nr:hypothetical protein [Planctomycetota bacterium]